MSILKTMRINKRLSLNKRTISSAQASPKNIKRVVPLIFLSSATTNIVKIFPREPKINVHKLNVVTKLTTVNLWIVDDDDSLLRREKFMVSWSADVKSEKCSLNAAQN